MDSTTKRILSSWATPTQRAWDELTKQGAVAITPGLRSIYRQDLHVYGSCLSSALDQASVGNEALFNIRQKAKDIFIRTRSEWHDEMVRQDDVPWDFRGNPLPGTKQFNVEVLAQAIDKALINWVNAGLGNIIDTKARE